MKIISWNVNGVKSVYEKGFLKIIEGLKADIFCLQEIKAKLDPLKASLIGIKKFDEEGRFLELKFPQFTLINFYAPHGGRKNENIILAGDFNIAHKEIDLARPKENENNTMFTLKEREN